MRNAKKSLKLEEVTERLSKIATPISLYLVPINFAEERNKFFDSATYNPVFRYRKVQNDNPKVLAGLEGVEEISDVDPEISKYIVRVIESKAQASDLLYSIGNDVRFPKISEDRFGLPNYWLFNRACKYLRKEYKNFKFAKDNENLESKMLKFDDVQKVFTVVFEQLGLIDWTLEKSKAIVESGFRTVVKSRRVMVDPDVEVSAEKLRKTIVHEVLTHALRANNGFNTGFEVFGKPNLPEYLDDEEGLAMYNEELYGVLREKDLRRRAALVYAIYLSRGMSFRQVYDALHSVYPKYNAFDVVSRVKRGLSDTSKHGSFTKDATYLRGFLKLRRTLTGDKVSYKYLYAGKLPMKYLYLVEEGIVPKAKVVPNREIVESIFKQAGLE